MMKQATALALATLCATACAVERRTTIVAAGYGDARVIADSQEACAAYGVPRGSVNFDRCVEDEFAARRPS